MRIQGTEQQIEIEVYDFLRDSLNENFEIVQGYNTFPGYKFDIAILRNRDVVAVIEIKRGAIVYEKNRLFYESIISRLRISGATYLVVTDADEYVVFSNESNSPVTVNGVEFVRCLLRGFPVSSNAPEPSFVADVIVDLALELRLRSVAAFLQKRRDRLFKIDEKSATIGFVSERIEDDFFKKLLPPARGIRRTCRYTSANSAFELLKESRQNMCNVLCMNDKSEGIYADVKVFGNTPSVSEKAFEESDHCYILSMMDDALADDLTMWRLYGDDAKGVCIRYWLKGQIQMHNADHFFLAKVSYGKSENGEEVHEELDFLRKIHRQDFGSGWRFKFKRWGIWKHFFKSYRFKDERETRLLYYDSNDEREQYEWIKNQSSQIVTKMQIFALNDFPFEVESIIVGPKCSEAELVSRQLQRLANCNKVRTTVRTSGINIYR